MPAAHGCSVPPAAGQPLYRNDRTAIGLDRQHQAGAHGHPVDAHGAGAAHTMLAGEMGAGIARCFAQEFAEAGTRVDDSGVTAAVDDSFIPRGGWIMASRCRASHRNVIKLGLYSQRVNAGLVHSSSTALVDRSAARAPARMYW